MGYGTLYFYLIRMGLMIGASAPIRKGNLAFKYVDFGVLGTIRL